jgi:hypothetical protein
MNAHPPEVLGALVARLRPEVWAAERAWRRSVPEIGTTVHELEREDIEAAVNAGVLQVDHLATLHLNAHREAPPPLHQTDTEEIRP